MLFQGFDYFIVYVKLLLLEAEVPRLVSCMAGFPNLLDRPYSDQVNK